MTEYVLYWRSMQNITWCYGGTYDSVEEAERQAKKELGKSVYQYKIEKRSREIVAICSVNF